MLRPEEKIEIDNELSISPTAEAASIEALKTIQRYRGWVSDEGIADLADYLKLSTAELDAKATFYNLIFRRKIGRHVIFVCDSISCWVMGYDKIRQKISQKLGIAFGQTTEDGKFTLLPIVCLGVCEHAPAMIIDEMLFEDLTPEKVDEIIEQIK